MFIRLNAYQQVWIQRIQEHVFTCVFLSYVKAVFVIPSKLMYEGKLTQGHMYV
jgi:hypothetical protein